MIRIKAFRAWRPRPSDAAKVACVPYDVVDTAEARALAAGNPISFLHAIRPEIELPDSTDPYAPVVYQRAASELERFKREVFVQEAEPAIYLYRQEMDMPSLGRRLSQTGVVTCCHIDDYMSGLIKKHEKTRQDKEDDRTRHVLAQNANAEPVFFMVKDRPDLATLIERGSAGAALFDFTAPDGVRHTICKASDPGAYVQAFARCECAYVADGHHRTASAARAGAEKRAANPNHTGNEEYNWFLAVLFPAANLTILPYHRLVKDLDGHTPVEFIERLRKIAKVTPGGPQSPDSPGKVAMYVRGCAGEPGAWHTIEFPREWVNASDPIGSLDYTILSERVLGPVLGIGDIRKDKRIDFVGGIRGPGELVKRVERGDAAVAFSMHPTTIDHLMRIADAGQIMPPKSTWFEPKLRSGLLVHTLD